MNGSTGSVPQQRSQTLGAFGGSCGGGRFPKRALYLKVSLPKREVMPVGNEATCTLKIGKQSFAGKALLETSEIIFRPADGRARRKIPFNAMTSVQAANGELQLVTAEGMMALDLGAYAERWRDKILHPKPRAEKLGVKPGANISLLGEFDDAFLSELRAGAKQITSGKIATGSDLIFLRANVAKDLPAGIGQAARTMKGATALWIVYPKGKKDITENGVLAAGRKAGLKDVKVVAFSPTHTALKFVIPVAKR